MLVSPSIPLAHFPVVHQHRILGVTAEKPCFTPQEAILTEGIDALRGNLSQALVGKEEAIDLLLVGLISAGHVLLEDVPGVGKTTLAKGLARSIDGSFRRIQFTPDLLPSDILGVSIYNPEDHSFEFKRGPIFSNVVLADEINRATPRTQSALLEAMNESQVSVDGETHLLSNPFIVIATQNPFEYEGTYPLPESQLDRFTLRLEIGYPGQAEEREVLLSHRFHEPVDLLSPVTTADEILAIQQKVKEVRVDESLLDYILQIGRASRDYEGIEIGVSPRGCLSLYRTAQAMALIRGRDYCVPDDVKQLAEPVLSHRLIYRRYSGVNSNHAIQEILKKIPVPV